MLACVKYWSKISLAVVIYKKKKLDVKPQLSNSSYNLIGLLSCAVLALTKQILMLAWN